METHTVWAASHGTALVGNALNAERQWRQPGPAAFLSCQVSCRERTERRKAMETNLCHTSLPMSRLRVGNALNAERQWRRLAANNMFHGLERVGNALNAERQWRLELEMCRVSSQSGRERTERRKAMETPSPTGLIGGGPPHVGNALNAERQWRHLPRFFPCLSLRQVGNALNAERQWRRFSSRDAYSTTLAGRERTERRKAMETRAHCSCTSARARQVGNALNAERQWRRYLLNKVKKKVPRSGTH